MPAPRLRPELRAYALLGIVMILWAGNSIVGRAVRDDIPPFTLAFVRWTGALLVLAPFALRQVVAEWAAIMRGWRPILLLGLTGVAAFNGLLYLGLHYTTATNGLLLQALIPALVLTTGAIAFGDRAPFGQIVGVVLSTLGVATIVFHGDPHAVLQLRFGFGDVLILCGCLAWAIYTVGLRRRPEISPFSFLFTTFVIGAVVMAPFAASESARVAAIDWTPGVVGAFLYVAVLPSVVAYLLYNAAVAQIGGAAAGQTISLMPLFGAVLAALLLGETLHGYHAIGMALILGGVAVAGWAITRRIQL